MEQQTLAESFTFQGVGIHTGTLARVTVSPASESEGRAFQIGTTRIPAHADYVVDTRRCTTLGVDAARVHTVEHLLSALHALSIDNALIVVDGAEIPILDGSALPFVEMIRAAGIVTQAAAPKTTRVLSSFVWSEAGAEIRIEPANVFQAEVTVMFTDWPEGNATVTATLGLDSGQDYAANIAPARTFAFRREVEALLAAGLAKGGSLENALVIEPPSTYSTPLRIPAEWAAHKLLDLIGDFALLDARPQMRVTALKPGHTSNTRAASELLQHYGGPATVPHNTQSGGF